MAVLRLGEIWQVRVNGACRAVKIIASAATPGWWWCTELSTVDMILAREEWFVEREQAATP